MLQTEAQLILPSPHRFEVREFVNKPTASAALPGLRKISSRLDHGLKFQFLAAPAAKKKLSLAFVVQYAVMRVEVEL